MSVRRPLLAFVLTPSVLIAVFLASLHSADPVYAVTHNVNVFADPNPDGSCTPSPGDCSLREAITAANAGSGDVIQLKAGAYNLTQAGSDDSNANGDLDIRAAMTIKGANNGATHISAAVINERVLHIDIPGDSAVTVTLNYLTIEDGAEGPFQKGGRHFQHRRLCDPGDRKQHRHRELRSPGRRHQ